MEDDIELLRLRAKAKLKLQEQEAQLPQEQPQEKEQGMLETAAKIAKPILQLQNAPGGLVRGELVNLTEPLTGAKKVTAEQITSGTVPGWSELLKGTNVDLSYMYPSFVRNIAKLTGTEEGLKKLAESTADVATDPTTALLPGLQAFRAVKGIAPAASNVARGLEVLLNPVGEIATPIAKGTYTGAKFLTGKTVGTVKKAALRGMGLTAKQADQMIQNPELFNTFKNAFLGQGGAIETQKAARESLKSLVDDLKKVGLSEDEALKASLVGTNVNVDLKQLRQSLNKITDPTARLKDANLLNEARKYRQANRPFAPEFMTEQARQSGVEGLVSKETPTEMITPSVTETVPEQQSLFESTAVKKPEYKGIPQPPKTPEASLLESEKLVAPTEEDLVNYYKWKDAYDALSEKSKNLRTYRYNKDIADIPIPPQEELLQTKIVAKTPEEELADLQKFMQAEEAVKSYEAKFPQLKQAKEPEFLIPPKTVEKVEGQIIPGKPAYSEYFPAEEIPLSTMLQEPLPFTQATGLPANLVRNFRQLLQKEAKYSMQGTPAKRQLADQADLLNIPLRKIDDLQAREAAMGRGKDLQKWIRAMSMSKKPITALSEASKNVDIRALLEEAAARASKVPTKVGKPKFEDIQATMEAAKKAADIQNEKSILTTTDLIKALTAGAMGQQYGGTPGGVMGTLIGLSTSPKIISKAVPALTSLESIVSKMPEAPEGIPQSIWSALVRSQMEGQNK